MNPRLIMIIALLVSSSAAFGEDQKAVESRISAKLQNAILVLRVPRTGRRITFDKDGKTKNDRGVRGFDDKLQVSSVHLLSGQLVIEGTRLHDVYIDRENTIESIAVRDPVEVRISTADSTNEQEITNMCRRVFLGRAEIAERFCADYSFLGRVMASHFRNEAKGKTSFVPAISEVCFPSGARGFNLEANPNEFKAPKLTKAAMEWCSPVTVI
jgi:hypothetical protein